MMNIPNVPVPVALNPDVASNNITGLMKTIEAMSQLHREIIEELLTALTGTENSSIIISSTRKNMKQFMENKNISTGYVESLGSHLNKSLLRASALEAQLEDMRGNNSQLTADLITLRSAFADTKLSLGGINALLKSNQASQGTPLVLDSKHLASLQHIVSTMHSAESSDDEEFEDRLAFIHPEDTIRKASSHSSVDDYDYETILQELSAVKVKSAQLETELNEIKSAYRHAERMNWQLKLELANAHSALDSYVTGDGEEEEVDGDTAEGDSNAIATPPNTLAGGGSAWGSYLWRKGE